MRNRIILLLCFAEILGFNMLNTPTPRVMAVAIMASIVTAVRKVCMIIDTLPHQTIQG